MKTFAKTALATAAASVVLGGIAYADHLNIDVDGATIEDGSIVFPSVKIDQDG